MVVRNFSACRFVFIGSLLEHLIDPASIAKLISTTRHWTDEAFEDFVNEVSFRVLLLVLRARACAGDAKARDSLIGHS